MRTEILVGDKFIVENEYKRQSVVLLIKHGMIVFEDYDPPTLDLPEKWGLSVFPYYAALAALKGKNIMKWYRNGVEI